MESSKFLNTIQLVTTIALFLGIVLVVWELRQAREIAKAEGVSASMGQYAQRIQSMMGENSAAALAKACDSPEKLTTEEMIILDNYYTEVTNNMRHTLLVQLVSDDLAVFDWKQWSGNFYTIFSTEYGRWWWSQVSWEPQIMEAGNNFLDNNEIRTCRDRYDGYRSRTKDLQPPLTSRCSGQAGMTSYDGK